MSPGCFRFWSVAVLSTSLLLAVGAAPCRAQTQDITGQLPEPYDLQDLHPPKQVIKTLLTPVNLRAWPRSLSLKEALGILYEELNRDGRELPILVDVDALVGKDPRARDVYDTPVVRPGNGRGTMMAAELLDFFVAQLPHGNGAWLVRRDYIEITTSEIASKVSGSEFYAEVWSLPVNLSDLRRPMPLGDALRRLTMQLYAQGYQTCFSLDWRAFVSPRGRQVDVVDVMVNFHEITGPMTVGQFLHHALQPLQQYGPTVLVHPYGIEITTFTAAQAWRDLMGQLARPVRVTPEYGSGVFGRPRKAKEAAG
jgi:hypothetical protein